jgi:multicomponent Na+:H+ antiporter subunit D
VGISTAETVPASALVPLVALTALTVGFGLFPEALLSTVQLAAQGLADPRAYIGSVFPGGN